MLRLPAEVLPLRGEFAPLFSKPVWEHAKVLLVGAILAPGPRTVTACVRVMGVSQEPCVVNSPRVLNRARWSPLAASPILLRVVVTPFAPAGELVCGLDDPSERRRGAPLTAQGISRDPVRSSHAPVGTASGWRWLCCMVVAKGSWAGSTWGLPVLTALCPSERDQTERGRRHQKLPERARHMMRWLPRWLPDRPLSLVGDGSVAALELLHAVRPRPHAHLLPRLRLEAERGHPAPARQPHHHGRPRVTGARRPSPPPRLEDPSTPWTRREVEPGEGEEKREVETYPETWVGDTSGFHPVVMRGVLGRDPPGE